jgi:hypothetical protein
MADHDAAAKLPWSTLKKTKTMKMMVMQKMLQMMEKRLMLHVASGWLALAVGDDSLSWMTTMTMMKKYNTHPHRQAAAPVHHHLRNPDLHVQRISCHHRNNAHCVCQQRLSPAIAVTLAELLNDDWLEQAVVDELHDMAKAINH